MKDQGCCKSNKDHGGHITPVLNCNAYPYGGCGAGYPYGYGINYGLHNPGVSGLDYHQYGSSFYAAHGGTPAACQNALGHSRCAGHLMGHFADYPSNTFSYLYNASTAYRPSGWGRDPSGTY